MTIEEMEYDVKIKLNRLDSNAFRGLLIPEIDWRLNEALNIYINNAIASKRPNGLGLEINERVAGDIAPLVVSTTIQTTGVVPFPSDFRNFIKAEATVKKGCTLKNRVWIVEHMNLADADYFLQPSFEWEEANGYFTSNGLQVTVDGTLESVSLTYVKKHPYMHNAKDFDPQGYVLPSGVLLQGKQDCLLRPLCHSEIVDLAVQMIAAELGLPNDPNKLTLTN